MADTQRKAKIFVDDGEDKFLGKTAVEKFDDWIEYYSGSEASIIDLQIKREEGINTVTVIYTD